MTRKLTILVLACASLLAACTQQRAALPGVSPTATPTPSPTPTATIAEEWHVAAAGDIACSTSQREKPSSRACQDGKTSDLMMGKDLDAVLALGDLQYENGALAEFRRSFDSTWGRFKDIMRPAPGNHDYGGGARGYFDYFGTTAGPRNQGWYSFEVGAWHLIALNSNCYAVKGCDASSPQVKWLRADLAANRARCTLAFWHHPRFSSGLHGDDDNVSAFWSALYEAGADLVLSGHDHHYERFAPQDPNGRRNDARGIREFVAGTGGRNLYAAIYGRANSQFRTSKSFGVLFLTLRPASYSWRFVDISGETVDSGTASCH